VIEQSTDQINNLRAKVKYLRKGYEDDILGCTSLISDYQPKFSLTPLESIYEGFTVTYVCLQLAFWMGFDTVLLVGVDHSYKFNGHPNAVNIAEGADENHFHKGYFSNGTKWHNPDLARSEQAYKMAELTFRQHGRKVINLTEGSKLDVFEKGNLNEW
jgi:hypothetical protein